MFVKKPLWLFLFSHQMGYFRTNNNIYMTNPNSINHNLRLLSNNIGVLSQSFRSHGPWFQGRSRNGWITLVGSFRTRAADTGCWPSTIACVDTCMGLVGNPTCRLCGSGEWRNSPCTSYVTVTHWHARDIKAFRSENHSWGDTVLCWKDRIPRRPWQGLKGLLVFYLWGGHCDRHYPRAIIYLRL